MDEALRFLEAIDGMSTFICDAVIKLCLLLSAVLLFLLGVALCIGITIWDNYEDEIRATATKVKAFFLKRILRFSGS